MQISKHTMAEKKCIYCDKPYDKDTEHVFPHGLGGEKVFLNCVCQKCNSKFGGILERELFQKSPIALSRSIESIKGYNKNKAFFKAPILLTFDEKNRIVYEISQHDEMKILLKSQIIEINGKYYLEGSDEKNIADFTQKLKAWNTNSLTAITRLPSNEDKTFDYVVFKKEDGEITFDSIISEDKINDSVLIQDFPESHELFDDLSPRLFFDDNQNLAIRAKSVYIGLDFLLNFLRYTNVPRVIKSFNSVVNDNGVVYVGQSFSRDKLERAVVKITLNILIHYFSDIKTNSSLKKHIDFVNSGYPKIIVRFEEKNDLMDSNDKTHNIFIHQYEDDIRLRLSLFNGQFVFTHIVPKLKILNHNEYYRFVNDYKVRKNRFESRNNILESIVNNELRLLTISNEKFI